MFAEDPYAGNQLATLPDTGDISSREMQQIARAFNFAEMTFITGGSLQAGFDVRIFTPVRELPFADDGVLWMRQNEPVFGEILDADEVAGQPGLSNMISLIRPAGWMSAWARDTRSAGHRSSA